MEKFSKKYYKHIIFIVIAFFTVVSLLNANNDSATFDEVAHIPAAYSYVTQHDTRINPEHPPLIKDLSGLPLLFMDLNFDTSQKFWTGELKNKWDEGQWAAGRHLLYEAGNDPDKIIFWARIPIIVLSIILGLFLFKWGREIAGTSAGLFALLLYACDPNILGHNHYVTTDLGIAAFLSFSFYYFLKFIKNPSWKNVLLGGIFLGLVLVTKFSSILVLPIFGLVLFAYALAKNNHEGKNHWKTRMRNLAIYSGKGIVALVIAVLVIWMVYEINMFSMPKEIFAETIDFFFSANDSNPKASYTNQALHWLNQNDLTRPLGTYLFGPAWMFKRVSGGNGAYFLGEVGNGFTWNFPVVFVIKEPLPFLILAMFAIIYTIKQSSTAFSSFSEMKYRFSRFLKRSVVEYALFGFIALYAFVSISGGLNIGFRHLFPILPFAYLLIAKKISDLTKGSNYFSKKTFNVIVLFLTAWIIFIPILAYPSYTSYFNESIGGSKNGYKYVTDSNTDWGQDLKRLRKYVDKHPEIDKIRVDYFGGSDIKRYIGEKSIIWWDSKRPVETGWYAISTNFLQGSIYDKENKTADDSYAWTLQYKPVAMIGNSILIFYVDKPPVI
ncbi:MAG: glycosyltransferase family 39 protein [Candidatus Moranbacteria bacterium]|nr:glycosyltransferase family 39 protein [Candidatus Moranbacteria bacterium]